MPDLPAGTRAPSGRCLFSDVAGSTRLREEPAFAAAYAAGRALTLAQAVAEARAE